LSPLDARATARAPTQAPGPLQINQGQQEAGGVKQQRRSSMAIEHWRPLGTLVERDPFGDLQSEVNRLFDNFLGRPTATVTGTGSQVWMPVVDMYDTNDNLVMNFELPGVREKDISLSITGDVLTVKGERQFDQPLNDDNYVRMERAYGRFERSIRLPVPVQAGRVQATYRAGVLEVSLAKAEEIRPKEI
jgi:HSP20 family protein